MDKSQRMRQVLDDFIGEHVDCSVCPPERNCCVFTSRYFTAFYQDTAKALFGDDLIQQLDLEGKLTYNPDRRQYILKDTKCPVLDEDFRCSAHSKLAEIGATSCTDYPLFYAPLFRPNKSDVYVECILADYRCHSLEANWDSVKDALTQLSETENIPVYMAFYNIEPVFLHMPLHRFTDLRERNLVPTQRPFMQEPSYKD